MKKVFPSPVLSLFLLGLWLTLNQSTDIDQIFLGICLSIFLVFITKEMRPLVPQKIRRPDLIVWLFILVTYDLIYSGIVVALVVLGPKSARQFSGFITVPIELSVPHALAILSMILSVTPGTIWADLSPDRMHLTIHVLNLRDAKRWEKLIKTRYETPLKKIFP